MHAGVLALPFSLPLVPVIIATSMSIKMTRAYRPQLVIAWCLAILAMGTLSMVRADTPLSHSLGFSALVLSGAGMLYQGTFFPVLAPLDVKDNAYALSFFYYCRQFASVSPSMRSNARDGY